MDSVDVAAPANPDPLAWLYERPFRPRYRRALVDASGAIVQHEGDPGATPDLWPASNVFVYAEPSYVATLPVLSPDDLTRSGSTLPPPPPAALVDPAATSAPTVDGPPSSSSTFTILWHLATYWTEDLDCPPLPPNRCDKCPPMDQRHAHLCPGPPKRHLCVLPGGHFEYCNLEHEQDGGFCYELLDAFEATQLAFATPAAFAAPAHFDPAALTVPTNISDRPSITYHPTLMIHDPPALVDDAPIINDGHPYQEEKRVRFAEASPSIFPVSSYPSLESMGWSTTVPSSPNVFIENGAVFCPSAFERSPGFHPGYPVDPLISSSEYTQSAYSSSLEQSHGLPLQTPYPPPLDWSYLQPPPIPHPPSVASTQPFPYASAHPSPPSTVYPSPFATVQAPAFSVSPPLAHFLAPPPGLFRPPPPRHRAAPPAPESLPLPGPPRSQRQTSHWQPQMQQWHSTPNPAFVSLETPRWHPETPYFEAHVYNPQHHPQFPSLPPPLPPSWS